MCLGGHGASITSCSFMKFTPDLSYKEAQVMTHICVTCLRNTLPFSSVELWNAFCRTWFIFYIGSFSESTKTRLWMQAHWVQCCDPHENTSHSTTGGSCHLHVIAGVECIKCLWASPPTTVFRERVANLFFLKSRHRQGPPQVVPSAFQT